MSDFYVCIYKQGSMQDYCRYSNRMVDQIRQKKFNFWSFCQSNYVEGSSTNYFRLNPI